jgi:FixJ family two-component response regulator
MAYATPTVFVVAVDVSVRESLEFLIRCAGWQPVTFASAQLFLPRHDSLPRVAWYLTSVFRTSTVWIFRSASAPIG